MRKKLLVILATLVVGLGFTGCGLLEPPIIGESVGYEDATNEFDIDRKIREEAEAAAAALALTVTPTPPISEEDTIKNFAREMNKRKNIDGGYNIGYTFPKSDKTRGKYYYYNPNYGYGNIYDGDDVTPLAVNYPSTEKIIELEKDLAFLYVNDVPEGMFYEGQFSTPKVFEFSEMTIGTRDRISIVNYEKNIYLDSNEIGVWVYYVFNEGNSKKSKLKLAIFTLDLETEEVKQIEDWTRYAESLSEFAKIYNFKYYWMEDLYDAPTKYCYFEDNGMFDIPNWATDFVDYVYDNNFVMKDDYDEFGWALRPDKEPDYIYQPETNVDTNNNSSNTSGGGLDALFGLVDQAGTEYFGTSNDSSTVANSSDYRTIAEPYALQYCYGELKYKYVMEGAWPGTVIVYFADDLPGGGKQPMIKVHLNDDGSYIKTVKDK